MKKFIKNVLPFIIILTITIFISFYKLPYVVLEPGGIENINNQFDFKGKNNVSGSINIAYIREVQPNIVYYLYAKIRNFEIEKIDEATIDEDKDLKFTYYIEKLMYESSISNAVYVAYTKANKKIDVSNIKQYVRYNANENSPLEIGDQIIEINGQKIDKLDSIKNIMNELDGDYVNITYIRDGKKINNDIKVIELDNRKLIGVIFITTFDYDTKPKLEYKLDKKSYGPSGGAMTTLSIYCSLIDEDLTHGLKIAGTGEMFTDGTIGPVGGVSYKIRSADKAKADIFFVPEDNYNEAKETKEKYKLKIKIVKVATFDDIVNYLENYK